MAKTKIEWVDELPGKPPQPRRGFYTPRGESKDLHEHAAELVKHPMRWSKYPRTITIRQAQSITNALQEGLIAAYSPDLGFEAARRGGDIYVRHNPDYIMPSRVAFYDGHRAGVRETLERVRSGIYQLRETLAEIERENIAAPRMPALGPLMNEKTNGA